VGRRRWLLDVAAVWIALGLSSCASFRDDTVSRPVAETPPPPPVVMTPPPVPRPTRKPPAPLRVPKSKPAPPATQDEVNEPKRLIGLDQSQTAQWLGEPDQRIDGLPATIWRYLTRNCQVDVYFYLDLQGRQWQVLHFDVTSDYIDGRRSERCFRQIVDEHRRRDDSPTSEMGWARYANVSRDGWSRGAGRVPVYRRAPEALQTVVGHRPLLFSAAGTVRAVSWFPSPAHSDKD
jgi:hypothetical protein